MAAAKLERVCREVGECIEAHQCWILDELRQVGGRQMLLGLLLSLVGRDCCSGRLLLLLLLKSPIGQRIRCCLEWRVLE